jgi:hypothetical protein
MYHLGPVLVSWVAESMHRNKAATRNLKAKGGDLKTRPDLRGE